MVLRQEVFVVEQNCPYLDADNKDTHAWHLLGYGNRKKLQAYARILPQWTSYKDAISIGRIATSQKIRGKGAGKELVNESLKQIKEIFGEENTVKISAQTYLLKFYEQFGFRSNGKEYLEDNIPHTEMILHQ